MKTNKDEKSPRIRLDRSLPGLWVGIAIWAVLCEAVGIFLVKDRVALSVGVISGALLSCAGVYHIWRMLDSSLGERDDKAAARRVGTGYIIRYTALIALVLILYFTGWGNPFAAFAAYLGMKPAAYLQPTLDRLFKRFKQGGEETCRE